MKIHTSDLNWSKFLCRWKKNIIQIDFSIECNETKKDKKNEWKNKSNIEKSQKFITEQLTIINKYFQKIRFNWKYLILYFNYLVWSSSKFIAPKIL